RAVRLVVAADDDVHAALDARAALVLDVEPEVRALPGGAPEPAGGTLVDVVPAAGDEPIERLGDRDDGVIQRAIASVVVVDDDADRERLRRRRRTDIHRPVVG